MNDNYSNRRNHAYADAAERIRFQANFAEKMLNALLLANGGAIVGLFTFIGNLIDKKDSPLTFSIHPLWASFACFVLGLAVTLVAHFLAFLSQQMFYYQSIEEAERFERALDGQPLVLGEAEVEHHYRGDRYYVAGLAAALVAVALFVIGCGAALYGLLPR